MDSAAAVLGLCGPVSASAQENCTPAPSGLVSWWSGDVTAVDHVGLNHGVLRFGAGYAEGKVGRGFSFSGGAFAVLETSTAELNVGTGDFSVEGWLKTTATKPTSTIFQFEGHFPALRVRGSAGTLQLSEAAVSATGGFNDGQFHHFAVVRRAGVITYYKDGQSAGTASFTQNVSANRFRIGSNTLGGENFDGVLDEISFFNRALSGDEMRAIFQAGSAGKCKLGKPSVLPRQFFIEAEDFDFGGGQHKSEADVMPYFGGAYAGLSALAGVDYNDPGNNENAEYRPASQGVALVGSGDNYREDIEVAPNFRIGWCDSGDWFNYTRAFPLPARDYYVYARLSSGALSNAVQLDVVTAGFGTTNQTLFKIGEARGRPSGGWGDFLSVPFRDSAGNPVKVRLGGQATLRLTVLPNSNQDINYLQFVPVPPALTAPCAAPLDGLVARWRAEGNAADATGAYPGELQNNVRFVPGRIGQAFQFEGNSYIGTTLNAQPSAMPTTTWEAWVLPTHPVGRQQILSTDDGGYDRTVGTEYHYFGVFVGAYQWLPTTITLNEWQHIAVIYSPTHVLFYKNGQRFVLGFPAPGQQTQYRLQIGRNPGFGEHFQGLVDEVSVYNRALTEEEIKALACDVIRFVDPIPDPVCPAVTLSPGSLPAGTAGAPYVQTLSGSGGTLPHSFALVSGALPNGLTLSSAGLISGTPVAAGPFSFGLRATDANACAGTTNYTLTIHPGGGSGSCVTPLSSLLAWWPGDGHTNSLIGAHPGALVNGATYAEGKVGQAFKFDGIDDRVAIAEASRINLSRTPRWTIAAWIKPASFTGQTWPTIYSEGRWGISLGLKNTTGQLDSWINSGNEAVSTSGVALNEWSLVALTYDGSRRTFYINGAAAGSASTPAINPDSNGSAIGDVTTNPNSSRFNGLIDELDVYKQALAESEIRALFLAGSAGKCKLGLARPILGAAPTALDFGDVPLNQTKELTLVLTNSGTGTLIVSNLLVSNSRFAVGGPTSGLSVSAGGQQSITIRFTPTDATLQAGTLTITSNDPGRPEMIVSLSGVGSTVSGPPLVLVPNPLDYGTVPLGQTRDLLLGIENRSGQVVNIASYQLFNTEYLLMSPPLPFTIDPGARSNLTIQFIPGTLGERTGWIRLTISHPDLPTITASLTGRGAPRDCAPITLSPATLPNGAVGSSYNQTISAAGGQAPRTFSLLSGSLPPGLNLSGLGVLSGTPTAAGVFTFSVGVTDAFARPGSIAYTLSIASGPVATRPALAVAKSGPNIVLAWPSDPPGFEIESAFSLSPPIFWMRVPNRPESIGGRNVLTLPLGGSTRFFRLSNTPATVSGSPSTSSTGQARVIASTGGTVATADASVSLVIPPGALPQDTEIGIARASVSGGPEHPSGGDVFLFPDGLKFSQPVTLRVQTPPNPATGQRLKVSLLSGAFPPRVVGGEISYFQPVTNFVFNRGTGQLEIPLTHFSAASWWFAKDLYAVLNIPGKFLSKGDLIYVLTGASNGQGGDWLPGHCGLYLGAKSAFGGLNDGQTIIESTQTRLAVLGEVRFDELSPATGQGFDKLAGTHIYMGARRPLEFEPTDNQRTDIADWAIAQLGKPYAIIGGGAFLATDTPLLYEGFTCVGFTELAYEFGANQRIVPQTARAGIFTPFRQFQWTRPVDTAEIETGEEFFCWIVGVVNQGTPVSNDYYTQRELYTAAVDLAACNDNARAVLHTNLRRARFEPEPSGSFSFVPTASDAGKEFKFAFVVDATKSGAGIERTAMTVKVAALPTRYRRIDPPIIQISQLGNLNKTNLVIEPSGLEASTTGRDSTTPRFRLTWDPPPSTLSTGASMGMNIRADAGANPATASFAFGGPYLAADVNQTVQFSALPAFAGYESTGNFNEHRLVQRSLSRIVTFDGQPSVTIYLDMYHSAGPAGGGRVTGSVTWGYQPID